jgi:hypothetical protein
MREIRPVSLGLKSSPARYKQGGCAVIINGFVEEIGEEGKTTWGVYASAGLQGFAALPDADGGVRAALEVDGVVYCVAGTRVYKVTSAGVVTLLASINIDETAHVKMRANRRVTPDVAIVCGGLMFNIRDDVVTQVTDGDLLPPLDMDFVDGFFGIVTSEGRWQVGAIDDATAWDALEFERADANRDAAVAMSSMQSQFVVLGRDTTEFWRNDGGADGTGFARVTVADVGCLSPGSVQRIEQTIAFVASDRTVRTFTNYAATTISTGEVARAIEQVADLGTIRSATWVLEGHTSYAITSPGMWTWVYDFATGLWHKRESYLSKSWRVSTVIAAFGKLIAGDALTGALYEMDNAFASESSEPLVMTVLTPPVHGFPYRVTHNAAFIDLERGVGLPIGEDDEVEPVLLFAWSDDGGETFGHERRLPIGRQGNRIIRVRTHRLGQVKEQGRVYRLSVSAKVRRALYAMSLDVEANAE